MNTTPKQALVVERVFDAKPAVIFEALTSADVMQQWFCPGSGWTADVENTPEVGGAYRVDMHSPEGKTYTHTGEYLELESPRKVVFTWNQHTVENTIVRIELQNDPRGTKLTLTHELLPDEEMRGHETGWNGCFDHLAEVLGSRS